jgi:phytoene dehydrogenase-like protein
MDNKFDVIIIGAGPNGLAIGAYLSKAGQKVLLIEKRLEEGGGLMTEQVTAPEFYHNTHALYMMMVDMAPVYKDLELETKWDVQHVFPELQATLPLLDGRSLCIYNDVDRTCESIAQFSKKDADSYRDMHAKYDEMMQEILGPQTYVPMEAAPLMAAKMEAVELGRELSEIGEKSPQEIVCDLYENDTVRTLMLYMGTHWGLDYAQSGVSYMVPIYLNRMVNYRITCGGSHRVSNALYKSIFEHKGQIRQSATIKRIIIENGEAKGVELENGRQYFAEKAVVSTIDPHQTFLNYVGRDNLEEDFVGMVENYMWEKWSLCNLHAALNEIPHFKAADKNPDVDKSLFYILGFEGMKDLTDYYDAITAGEMPDQFGLTCTFPSVHDGYQAPAGKATAYISQMAPYDLKDGGKEKWLNRDYRLARAEEMIKLVSKYTTNTDKDKIIATYMTTPTDIENKYASMVRGGYKHGAYHPLQMGFLRPNQDCSQYRTPVKNLYVGGASVAPGGMIIWGPGYNCANAIAEDCGIEKWWPELEMVTKAREKGFV